MSSVESEVKNPWQISIEEQMDRLRYAYAVSFCRSTAVKEPSLSELQHLVRMAPSWPDGRLAFRGLRVRFAGVKKEGVATTFEAHARHIYAMFPNGSDVMIDFLLMSEQPVHIPVANIAERKEYRLRLLVGNDTHKPTVEWVCFDIDTNQQRESITAVRGPRSLADELLVFMWMFPDYIRSIDYKENPGLFAGGYEANFPEISSGSWQEVPFVGWDRKESSLKRSALWCKNNDPGYSVPVLLD